jgi:CHAT domain-containing protein
VHIATHGRHQVAAPAFQCLFVAPDDGRDAEVAAYQLLDLDLSGLELVTLSACETGLGRFDRSDNLRGIPASLLLRGAAALVATLWPVETEVSEAFFTRLYTHIGDDDGPLEAFFAAQRECRQHFPQYRDWGAFQYLGH